MATTNGNEGQAVIVKPVFDLLGKDEAFRRQVALALPAIGITPERMLRVILTECRRIPALFKCSKESMMEAVMMCAETGLLPGRMGFCSIIPYKTEATFQLGYKGVVQLIWRHERVISVRAECVYEADEFTDRLDGAPTWVPSRLPVAERGPITDVFAVIAVSGGGVVVKAWPYADVLAHRDRYSKQWKRQGERSTWGQHPEIMACKTMLIQASKWAPLTTEAANAIAGDERGDTVGLVAPVGSDELADDLEAAAANALNDIDESLSGGDDTASGAPPAGAPEGGGVGAPAGTTVPTGPPPSQPQTQDEVERLAKREAVKLEAAMGTDELGDPSGLRPEEIRDLDRDQLLSIIDERAKGLELKPADVRRSLSAMYEVRNIGGVDDDGLRWAIGNWSSLVEQWAAEAEAAAGAEGEANGEPDPEQASADAEADAANGNGTLPGVQ